jgi:quercetin dioxygenase-like cupin family protein
MRIMYAILTSLLLLGAASHSADAQVPRDRDPAVVNPSSIKVMLENDSVRVMLAELPPGFKEKEHSHPAYVMYILSGGNVRMHLSDGTTRDAELKEGMTLFSPSVTHWAENTGNTTLRILLVELRRKAQQ